ncbi:hypothetical protein Tsp_05520 [Trichinella spiralis]|uniref:hypothetical protein n=1 Tax=Trichinella spiralis TaxID=6334 RepID=UPI0001EFDBA2|nr:hypothetical protein Tsp_05520 [Trichinella spiralis]
MRRTHELLVCWQAGKQDGVRICTNCRRELISTTTTTSTDQSVTNKPTPQNLTHVASWCKLTVEIHFRFAKFAASPQQQHQQQHARTIPLDKTIYWENIQFENY